MNTRSPQRLGGVLMTDQRSADEAVMILWLTPAADGNAALQRILDGHVIIASLHVAKKPDGGVWFDAISKPVLYDASGAELIQVIDAFMGADMQGVLTRLRNRLRTRQSAETAVLSGLADRLNFYVFEKGPEPVGPGWMVVYAGRTYPMTGADGRR